MGYFLGEFLQSRANLFSSAAPSEPSKLFLKLSSHGWLELFLIKVISECFREEKKKVLFSWKYLFWSWISETTKKKINSKWCPLHLGVPGLPSEKSPPWHGGLEGCGWVLMPGWVSKRLLEQLLFCEAGKGLLKWEAICRIRVCFRGPKKT